MEIKAGLEIHQQLDTHKLFCNCPSVLRNDEPEFEVKRKLHAVAGQSGDIDVAAKHETSKDREFFYQGYGTTCLVELDEEPPHLINSEALMIALHIALHLNCEIVPITQIMRKTVVDGSNTSGFQRTVLIARDGYIETREGRVGIGSVYLEEDSSRAVSRDKKRVIWRLDRLGIPLVEIQTEPDIRTPEQAKEAALYIGDVLRSCKVKRGIGTIRQDINVSISGHPRVEIKGFQDVKMFIPVIEREIKRQQENIKKKNLKSEVRKALDDGSTDFLRPMPGAARMYPETDLPLLKISRKMIDEAKKTLPKLTEKIREELRKKGLNESMIKLLTKKGLIDEFKVLLGLVDEPKFIYRVLVEIPLEISRHTGKDVSGRLTLDVIEDIVRAVSEKRIDKSDVKHVMEEVVSGKSVEDALKVEKADLGKIETEAARLIKEKPGLSIGAYMGLIMQKFKGKISGKEASEILKKLMK
ncbi:Glu-tRNA(Gln) amidotransferase subunit GatE [Candidatus Pacearchaeota archaeon]|nr:Glu-tRNA(Gln) amidotransferase subunit GatE [Candidatus Pacearchaeota archaeon]MBD3283558.1 Glu-tRNA(Gln) amidotransferase subunit GatE [Candidatus Pacearchaeota archaeon]